MGRSRSRSKADPIDAWDARLRRKYGITAADFAAMWMRQSGRCPICGKQLVRGKGKACVDHDHKTGRVRGILCGMYCNKRVIGALERMGIERAVGGMIYLGWDLGVPE